MKENLLIILLILYMSLLFGQIEYNEEFQLNTIMNGSVNSIAILDTGKFVISAQTWYQPDYYDIYGAIFNSKGKMVSDEFPVNTYVRGEQSHSKIAVISDDKFIICWQSWRQDGTGYSIYAQIFDFNGIKVGEEFQVNSNKLGSQKEPHVLKMSQENFIIFWETHDGFCIQNYKNNGNKFNDEIQLIKSENYMAFTKIIKISDEKFAVFWIDYGDYSISCQLFDLNGEPKGNVIKLIEEDYTFSITKLPNNKFFLSYINREVGIEGQIFNYSGDKIGKTLKISDIYTHYWYMEPQCKYINNNKIICCWFDYIDNNSIYNIYARIIDLDSHASSRIFQVNSIQYNDNLEPVVETLSDEKLILTWTNYDFDNDESNIKGKIYYTEPQIHDLNNFHIVSPKTDETLTNAKPEFKWQSSYNSHKNFPWDVTYDLYISNTEDFSDPMIYRELEDTTFQMPDTLKKGQICYWKVQAVNWEHDSLWCSNVNGFFVSHDAEVGIDEEETVLSEFSLSQNYPNPFNPTTTISFEIPYSTNVEISVYSLSGKKIKTLINSNYNFGYYNITWDGTDSFGTKVSSGIYLYKIKTDSKVITRKMISIK